MWKEVVDEAQTIVAKPKACTRVMKPSQNVDNTQIQKMLQIEGRPIIKRIVTSGKTCC